MAVGGGTDWLSLGASVGGAILGFMGNKSSAKAQTKAQKKALKAAQAERERGRVAALDAISPDLDSGGADVLLKNRMTADPSVLTPAQQLSLEDTIRIGRNNLSAGGLRGAGRAGQAVLNDAVRRTKADAFTSNQARSDQAVNTLAARGANARSSAANIETGTSGANAGNIINTGNDIADTSGALPVAQANLAGSTLGAIASMMANRKPTSPYAGASLNSIL